MAGLSTLTATSLPQGMLYVNKYIGQQWLR